MVYCAKLFFKWKAKELLPAIIMNTKLIFHKMRYAMVTHFNISYQPQSKSKNFDLTLSRSLLLYPSEETPFLRSLSLSYYIFPTRSVCSTLTHHLFSFIFFASLSCSFSIHISADLCWIKEFKLSLIVCYVIRV